MYANPSQFGFEAPASPPSVVDGVPGCFSRITGLPGPRNPDPPDIEPQGPDNGATLRPPMLISAVSWFTILGSNLNSRLGAGGERRLTADKLAGTVVKVNGAAVPLSYASPTQINAYLPLQTVPRPCPPTGIPDCRQSELEVTVSAAGSDPFHTASFRLTTADATPGVLISTLEDGYWTIWATDSGPMVASGTFQITQTIPVVRVGGLESRVLYSGLAPGWLGLYQVNVELLTIH